MSSGNSSIQWSEWEWRPDWGCWYRSGTDNVTGMIHDDYNYDEQVPRQSDVDSIQQEFAAVSLDNPTPGSYSDNTAYSLAKTVTSRDSAYYGTSPSNQPRARDRDKHRDREKGDRDKDRDKERSGRHDRHKAAKDTRERPGRRDAKNPPVLVRGGNAKEPSSDRRHRSQREEPAGEHPSEPFYERNPPIPSIPETPGGIPYTPADPANYPAAYGAPQDAKDRPAHPGEEEAYVPGANLYSFSQTPQDLYVPEQRQEQQQYNIEERDEEYDETQQQQQGVPMSQPLNTPYSTDAYGGYGQDVVYQDAASDDLRMPAHGRNPKALHGYSNFPSQTRHGALHEHDAQIPTEDASFDIYGQDLRSGATQDAYQMHGTLATWEEDRAPTPTQRTIKSGQQKSKKLDIRGTPARGLAEELDPRYVIEPSKRFNVGEIFKILWSEPMGAGGGARTEDIDKMTERETRNDQFGQSFYVGFRRFIVAKNDDGHATCVPILTYEGRACTKKGLKPDKHGIIYASGKRPRMLRNEPQLGFSPIKMVVDIEGETLAETSRVNYSKLTTIEHNVKVFFIGRIPYEDIGTFEDAIETCWRGKKDSKHRRR